MVTGGGSAPIPCGRSSFALGIGSVWKNFCNVHVCCWLMKGSVCFVLSGARSSMPSVAGREAAIEVNDRFAWGRELDSPLFGVRSVQLGRILSGSPQPSATPNATG